MKQFSDFNIKPASKGFTGDKIRIERIFNKQIVVHGYKVEGSRFEKGSGKCLHMQISVKDTMHVVFTGSLALIDQIERVPKENFPFETTIVKENDRFEFT